ncbi:hypothetical protein [Streptomyces sp. DT18]
MAITDDLRKTLTDPTPLYFAAGTAELAVEQALRLPAILDQLRAEAPARIQAVRESDPKEIQDRAVARAREAQAVARAAVTEVVTAFSSREGRDAELKRFQESAQGFALRGFGLAAEYAVRARETYEKVAERGEEAVRGWRGEEAVRGWRGEEADGYGYEGGAGTGTRSGGADEAPAPGAPRVAVDPEPDEPAERVEPAECVEPVERVEPVVVTKTVPDEPVVTTKTVPDVPVATTEPAPEAVAEAPEAAPAPAGESPAPRKAAPRRAARPTAKPAARKPAAKKPSATPPARKSAEETPATSPAERDAQRDTEGSAGGAQE